jgi:molecular chaperone HscA
MALLQISDPLAAPIPVGIDLGTTHSLVAYVPAIGGPTTISDCDNDPLVPSVAFYRAGGEVIVGREAQRRAREFPRDTIVSVKRFMGRSADDPETRRLGPYRFAADSGPVVQFEVAGGRKITPVEVSADLLRTLKQRAEDELGAIGGVVITVPAYFDDAQRQATKDAGRLAGLDVLRLLNEPTAAALAYGLDSRRDGTFAVYDLGGGTFDITILVLDHGVFQVRSTGGDSQLGGDDIDRVLAERLLQASGYTDPAAASPGLVRSLIDSARAIKHALSEQPQVDAELELPGGEKVVHRITAAELEVMVRPWLARTGTACRRALRDAGLVPADLDGVILVGGSTRMPAVQKYVAELFQCEPLTSIDPDQVVALGAAIQADILAGTNTKEDVLLLDVLPLSLGIEAMGGVVEKILPRNTAIPAAAAQVFTTYAENQTGFELHVVQGEREMAEDCRSLARFTLRGIPPMSAGIARLEVRFEVDADGILHVNARELTTSVEQQVEVKPSHGLSDEQVERMLLEAYDHAEEDISARAIRERRVEAERLLAATRAGLEQGAELLEPGERERIEASMQVLADAAKLEDTRAIDLRIEELDHLCKPFAERRMDASIRKALAGQSLTDIERQTAHAVGIEPHLGSED